MSLSVKFNGVELNNYIQVLSGFTPRAGVEFSPTLMDLSGTSKGSKYQYTSYKAKQIPMPFEIKGDIEGKYNALMAALNVDKPKPLIFGSTPQKVYYAIPSGDLDMEEVYRFGSGTITWVIPAGVAFGLAEKTASNEENSTQVTLENTGTESVPVSVKVTMKSDNGYLGMSLEDHYYQVGNPEEPDIEESEGTILLFNDISGNIYTNWTLNNGVLPPVLQLQGKGCKEQGAVGYSNDTCYVSDYGDRAGNADGIYWRGPSKTKTVPQDSNGDYPINWTCSYEIEFTNLRENSNPDYPDYNLMCCGISAMVFSDASGEVILWIGLQQLLGNKMLYINDKRVSLTSPDRGKNIVKSIEIEKIGDAATIRFLMTNGTTSIQKVNISKSTSELRKITWFAGMYLHQDVMEENSFKSMMFKKHNVEKIEDIPNYFSEGDVVYLSGEENKLYINDYLNWDVTDIGSQPLLLPPGQHTLGVLTSSFAKVPDIEVTFRERWV